MIENIEKELNYIFPKDYKEYMNNNGNLKFENNIIKFNNNEKVFRTLYCFDSDNKYYYILNKQYFGDSKYSNTLVAIGEFEFGDLLCFNKNDNKVVIYDHELDEITPIADTFSELL